MFKNWQKLCVFLTRRCNLRCRGCNVINYNSAYELTTQEWKRVFDIAKKYKVGFIVLFGGEPTLRDDLPELVKYLNKIKMPHTIITNGIRLLNDKDFYEKLLKANPYGISCSVNTLKIKKDFSDNIKSNIGTKLLLKLKQDGYKGDLVANVAITRENLKELPKMAQFFTEKNIWLILTFIHLCSPYQSMYWWYRGPIDKYNKSMIFRKEDKKDLSKIANWFIKNYENLKLHNSKEYFYQWPTLGITQNWKCSEWVSPQVNPDGSLMACVDRPLSKPFSIFDFPKKEKEIYENFKETIKNCPGCFWDHMWDCHLYVRLNKVEYGKKKFQHRI